MSVSEPGAWPILYHQSLSRTIRPPRLALTFVRINQPVRGRHIRLPQARIDVAALQCVILVVEAGFTVEGVAARFGDDLEETALGKAHLGGFAAFDHLDFLDDVVQNRLVWLL